MTVFTVTEEFWHKGVLQPVGKEVQLNDAEAKYLKHALAVKKDAEEVHTPIRKAAHKSRKRVSLGVDVVESGVDVVESASHGEDTN